MSLHLKVPFITSYMILQKEYNRSAKWDKEKDVWSVEDKPRYRWTYIDDTPASEWYEELNDALKWIIEHDRK